MKIKMGLIWDSAGVLPFFYNIPRFGVFSLYKLTKALHPNDAARSRGEELRAELHLLMAAQGRRTR